jgi:hypothetical protein
MSDQDETDTLNASSRSVRRHHVERLKKSRSTYWGYPRHSNGQDKAMTPRALGKVVQTPKECGCWMCSRPRKVFSERTMQEQRAMQPMLQEWPAAKAQ